MCVQNIIYLRNIDTASTIFIIVRPIQQTLFIFMSAYNKGIFKTISGYKSQIFTNE